MADCFLRDSGATNRSASDPECLHALPECPARTLAENRTDPEDDPVILVGGCNGLVVLSGEQFKDYQKGVGIFCAFIALPVILVLVVSALFG